jgi:hypothetical protein
MLRPSTIFLIFVFLVLVVLAISLPFLFPSNTNTSPVPDKRNPDTGQSENSAKVAHDVRTDTISFQPGVTNPQLTVPVSARVLHGNLKVELTKRSKVLFGAALTFEVTELLHDAFETRVLPRFASWPVSQQPHQFVPDNVWHHLTASFHESTLWVFAATEKRVDCFRFVDEALIEPRRVASLQLPFDSGKPTAVLHQANTLSLAVQTDDAVHVYRFNCGEEMWLPPASIVILPDTKSLTTVAVDGTFRVAGVRQGDVVLKDPKMQVEQTVQADFLPRISLAFDATSRSCAFAAVDREYCVHFSRHGDLIRLGVKADVLDLAYFGTVPAVAAARGNIITFSHAVNSSGTAWSDAMQVCQARSNPSHMTLLQARGLPRLFFFLPPDEHLGELWMVAAANAEGSTWCQPTFVLSSSVNPSVSSNKDGIAVVGLASDQLVREFIPTADAELWWTVSVP